MAQSVKSSKYAEVVNILIFVYNAHIITIHKKNVAW